jgi:SpoVK/Ycf46/Vps4 family AAA+-type ATPase
VDTIIPITKPLSELALLPYINNSEYMKEQLQWLDVCLSFQNELQETELEGDRRADLIMQYTDYDRSYRSHLESRIQVSMREGVFLTLPYLSTIFELTSLEEKVILICLAIELDRKYESAYELLQLGLGGKLPTLDLIATLISRTEEDRLSVLHSLRPGSTLRKMFLHREIPTRQGSILSQPVRLEQRIVQYLTGSRDLPESMDSYASLLFPDREPAPLLGNKAVQSKLRRWITHRSQTDLGGRSLIISLWGKQGAGKRTQAAHLGHYFHEPLLLVDVAKLSRTTELVNDSLQHVFREATIQQAVLVLTHFHAGIGGGNQLHRISDILDEISGMHGIVVLLSEEPCQALDNNNRIDLELEIAPLQDEERAEAWQSLAQGYELGEDVDWGVLSTRFLFAPGQIVNALKSAKDLAEWDWTGEGQVRIGWHHIIQASYKQLNHQLGKKATKLSPINNWDDLILPELQKDKLLHARNHIQYKHTVYGRWGFNKKLSYGTGISLLFSGPPGTGKTMAAEIVANELDMEIYKIDLSQIISKYIGETEKNLREIFDEAQSSYAVLFFDEADALFGKRSEVKDSHDKNANTEVAFLLQKMEEYRGISIMATNYLQNIDEAFLRRINYVIRFPFPDEKQRELIWRHIYPQQTPLEDDINYDFLARKLQTAGGSIKNIALTSAFLASGNQEAVGMKHILKAYQYELDKTNRAITRGELGEYVYLFDQLFV